MKKIILFTSAFLSVLACSAVNQVSESQLRYVKQYENQANIPVPAEMLLNTDAEPQLTEGFTDLYNGKNLEGWTPLGGHCTFEAKGDVILGTTVKGSPSTYLSTDKDDYADFIFTAEIKWEVNGNSGIMFRGQSRPGKDYDIVFGPQCEMEGTDLVRGWSGGIFGQSAGGWAYPLWLEAHQEVRNAIKPDGWNRVTIQAIGTNVKTWINGVPAANWETEEYTKGFFSLQVHSGKEGSIHFRNIKVKDLDNATHAKDLFASGDFSEWTKVNGKPVSNGWSIEDGVVHRDGIKPGNIITRKHYKDFDLRFDWKIRVGGNSGVKYRTRGRLGLEYQILDDSVHKDKHLSAGIYALVPAAKNKPYNPGGQWNSGRIIAQGNHVEHWINGVKVVEAEIGSEDWFERFNSSKYNKHEGFGTWTGPILLQDHLDEAWFRNVQIREL
jgi:hypothetical protein